jgi:hypothetical protein
MNEIGINEILIILAITALWGVLLWRLWRRGGT